MRPKMSCDLRENYADTRDTEEQAKGSLTVEAS